MQSRILIQRRASRVLVALAGAALACNLTPSATPTSAPEPISSPEPALLPSPTAAIEPTAAEPPTASPVPAPTTPPGWLTYRNEMLGYEFDYPPEAELIAVGVTGYPTDELPPGLEPGQYIPTLEATYPEALCAGIEFGTAYLYVGAPDDLGGKYSTPCGISGVGVYELRPIEEIILIGGESATASGDQGYSLQDGTFLFEFLFARLREFRFNYGGDWNRPGLNHDVYLADKAIIMQVLASWRWIGP